MVDELDLHLHPKWQRHVIRHLKATFQLLQFITTTRQVGDFDNLDVKKQGDKFVGAQRVRLTFKIRDASPQGFHLKACEWSFAVELSYVMQDRIEGRWEGYPPDSQINPLTCERSGERTWQGVAWIRK